MGLTLCNKLVCNTYPGVLKTCDNAALTATPKPMTDGVGNAVPFSMGTSCIVYTGTQDFTGATVTGITGATAGLVNGTGTDSMRSDITAITPSALGTCSIALGDGAYADCCNSIAIGKGATILGAEGIGIGFAATASADGGLAIGRGTSVSDYSVALGYNSVGSGSRSIAIGASTIGSGDCSVTIGCGSAARGTNSVAIGHDSETFTGVINSVAIGRFNAVDQSQSVAIGCNNFLGLVSGTGDSNVAIGVTNCVEGSCNIAIGSNNCTTVCESIVMGNGASSGFEYGIALGSGSCANGAGNIAIGKTTCSNGCESIVIGNLSCSTGTGSFQNAIFGTNNTSEACRNVILGNNMISESFGNVNIGNSNAVCCGTALQPWRNINIGYSVNTIGSTTSINIGNSNTVCNASSSVILGHNISTTSTSAYAITIGCGSVGGGGTGNTVIGYRSCFIAGGYSGSQIVGYCNLMTNIQNGSVFGAFSSVTANNAVALGCGVTAARNGVVTSREYESCVAGCGLIVKTPDGLNSYRIAVDNSGNITTALA